MQRTRILLWKLPLTIPSNILKFVIHEETGIEWHHTTKLRNVQIRRIIIKAPLYWNFRQFQIKEKQVLGQLFFTEKNTKHSLRRVFDVKFSTRPEYRSDLEKVQEGIWKDPWQMDLERLTIVICFCFYSKLMDDTDKESSNKWSTAR